VPLGRSLGRSLAADSVEWPWASETEFDCEVEEVEEGDE
jgi:hypothetical protein